MAENRTRGGWGALLLNLVLFAAAAVAAFAGFLVGGAAGLALLGLGGLLFVAAMLVLFLGARRARASDPGLGGPDQWWYNHRTGEVEQGPLSLGSERDGPYATREDALRAPEIARERAQRWSQEEEG